MKSPRSSAHARERSARIYIAGVPGFTNSWRKTMDDLAERLRKIERNPSPDLWDEITDRAVGSVPRTATQHGWRRVAIIAASLAIGLAAVVWVVIAIRPTTSPPVAVDQLFAWPNNSCGLVTNSEVEAATHSKVTQSGLLTDAQLIFPAGPNPCQYKTNDEHTSLTVFVRPNDIDEFNRVRDRDPANVEVLPGLGDEAFSHAGADVWVRVGSGYFVISSQHGAGDEGVSELEALARLALGSRDATLLVSSSGPSGDQAYLSGTLTTENGCVAVQTGPALSIYVVWPNGYSLADEGGETWLVDDSGNRIAGMGDVIQMGGGSMDLANAEREMSTSMPAACVKGGPDAYWLAGAPEAVIGSLVDGQTKPVQLPGIDTYRVCRVLSLPGHFGEAGDEVVVFEEERVPGAGCISSEGFQHIAVLRDGQVTALSRRITDLAGDDAWKVWPYATPDLDGDGTDEIVVAGTYTTGVAPRVWFFTLSPGGGGIEAIYEPGAVPDPSRTGSFTRPIASGIDAASVRPQGVYCEREAGSRVIVTWEASRDDSLDVVETRWRLLSTDLEFVSQSTVHIGERGYPDAGDVALCGSPVSPRSSYP
jgi:hypothetical protein